MKIRKTTISEIDCAKIIEGPETILFLNDHYQWTLAEFIVKNRNQENEHYLLEINGKEITIAESGMCDNFYILETPFDPEPDWADLKNTIII